MKAHYIPFKKTKRFILSSTAIVLLAVCLLGGKNGAFAQTPINNMISEHASVAGLHVKRLQQQSLTDLLTVFSNYKMETLTPSSPSPHKELNMQEEVHINDSIQKELEQHIARTNERQWNNALFALERPAYYEFVDGKFEPNKIFYANLLETDLQSLRQTQFGIATGATIPVELLNMQEERVSKLLEAFKIAPGITPFVFNLNHSKSVADKYGVDVASTDFFNSKYNSSDVYETGKFNGSAQRQAQVAYEDKLKRMLTISGTTSDEKVAVADKECLPEIKEL